MEKIGLKINYIVVINIANLDLYEDIIFLSLNPIEVPKKIRKKTVRPITKKTKTMKPVTIRVTSMRPTMISDVSCINRFDKKLGMDGLNAMSVPI